MAEKPATVTRNALLDVFLPAMRGFIRVKFQAHLLEREGQGSNPTKAADRAARQRKAAAWHEEVLKCLPKRRADQIRANLDRFQRTEDQIEIGDLPHIFRERPRLFPDAFRPGGRLHNGLLPLQDTRNESVHQLVETWALTKAIRVLETCRDILIACGSSDTTDLANDLDKRFIKDLRTQLEPSPPRDDELRDAQPDGAPNFVDQDEEHRSAQSEGAANLRDQGDEPRDRQPEGAPNLAGQAGEPPAHRTGGVGSRTWGRFWPVAVVLVIAAMILAGVCASSSGNGPPVCSEIDDVVLTGPGDPNGTVALGGHCTDADDDELTFTAASSDNDIVSAAVEGDLLTLTAGDGSGGTATITVTATDPDGRSDTASFDVTVSPPAVTPPNRPPDCDDVEDVTVVEGEEQEVFVSCSDDDGDTITLRVSAESQTNYHSVSPNVASIAGSGAQSFTIAGLRSSAGAGYVEIEADDGKGGTDMVRFSVVVDAAVVDAGEDGPTEPDETEPPSVEPPEIEGSISCAPSPVATNTSVNCTVSLSHGTPPFTYEWRGGSSLNTASNSYHTSFGSEGSQSVSLTVSNDGGSDDASTTVQVMEVPTINSLGCPSSATENQTVNCSPSVSGTEPFTYRWSGGGSGGSGSSYSPSWSATGRKTVSLTVTNAVGSDNGSTSVVVDEDVRRPEIDSIICESPVATNASANCRVNLSGGAPDSYSWSDSDGGSGNSASYRASFSAPGMKTVRLTVRNTADSDSDSTTVRVMTPPTISSLGCPSSVTENEVVTCSPSVSGTGPFTYGWSDGESVGVQASYSLSWSTIGVKTVWLSVLNDVGDDQQSTTVYVNGVPRCEVPAVATANDGKVGYFTYSLDLNRYCNDPDGDSLSYTVEPRSDSDDSVATGSVSNGVLTIYEHGAGKTTIWVTVRDGRGGSTEVAVSVGVSEPEIIAEEQEPEPVIVADESRPDAIAVLGPANSAPTCAIGDLNLVEGDYETLYLADHCVDHSDGNRLTFEAESSNSSVVSLYGPDGRRGSLEVNADGGGWATITVLATDSAGRTGVETFIVEVTSDVTCSLDPDDDEILTSLTRDPATYTYALRCQDPTGARLSYTLPSDDNNVASASYDGNTLTISIHGRGLNNHGLTTIRFAATAPDGRSWKREFVVAVNP